MSIHMRNNHGIYKLSEKFYDSYPRSQYKEILKKRDRPYNCMIISMEKGYMISIPYRSNINHRANVAQWQERIAECRRSGKTVRSWCQENSL